MDQQPLEESGSFFDELTGTISLWIIVVLGITSIALVPAFYFFVRNNAAAMGSGVTLVASVVSFALVRRGRTTAGNAIFFAVFILIINGVAYASLAVPEQYAAALISVIGLLLVVTAPTGILIHPMYPVVAGVISTALIGFFVVRSGIPTLIQRIPIFVVVILFNSGVSYVVSVVTRKLVDRTARANERSNKAIRELTGIIRAMDGLRAPLEETSRQSRDYLDQIETIIATYVETVDTISAEAVTMSDRVRTARDNLSRLTDAVNDVNVRLAEQERLVQDTGDARLRLETSLRENADSIKETKHATDQLEEASRAGDARIEEVFQRIQLLEERQSRLLEINEVISTIAEQTGLLAMNAAIEAAHAGEAGRGFAVVASEVGKLAADTNERSAEITRLIREMRETIEVTSTGAHEARRALEEINVRVQAVHNGIDATQKQSETFIRFGESLAGNLEALNQNTHHIENRSTEEQTVLREYETSFGDLTRNLGHLAERIRELADHNQRGTVIMRNLANVRERTGATDEEVSSLIERSLAVTIDDSSPV